MSQQSPQKGPTHGSVRVEFFVPGVFAFGIDNAARNDNGVMKAFDYVRFIETQLFLQCCSGLHPVAVFSRGEIEELYQRAQDSPYKVLLSEVEKSYNAFTAICPICGRSGKLPLTV